MSNQPSGQMAVNCKFKVFPYLGLPLLGLALLFTRLGKLDSWRLLFYELILLFGYIAALSDIRTRKVSNRLVLTMLAAWLIPFIFRLFAGIDTALLLLADGVLGMFGAGGLFLLVYALSRKGLGGGDVKFAAATGLYLGLSAVIAAILYGTLAAALTGILLMVFKKLGRKDTIPLIPFLYGGILIIVFLT